MQLISDTLTNLRLCQSTTFLNLTVFPLRGSKSAGRDYVTLREAIQAETASVREVSQGGSVPELLLENRGDKPVLILEGEEVIGAKQNRTANVTILAPAGKTIRIPVTCVEAGRWSYRSREFAPSQQMHFSKGRQRKMASVARSMLRSGQRVADQSEVWSDISAKCASMNVDAPTAAMSDVYDTHRTKVEDYVRAFEAQPGQVAAVFAIGDRIEGLELFDCDQTLADMLPKIVRSYAIDAVETIARHRRNPSAVSADAFIQRVASADVEAAPAVGLGTEIRLAGRGVIAAGLIDNDRVVHLAAFAEAAESNRRRGGAQGELPLHWGRSRR